MFLNIHTLFSLPVNCLNRDDAGRPKTAVVHGIERTRQSSQSLKAAYRPAFREAGLDVADRTKFFNQTILDAIGDRLPEEQAQQTAYALIDYLGKVDEKATKAKGVPVATTLALVTTSQLRAAVEVVLTHDPAIKSGKSGSFTFDMAASGAIKDRVKGQGTTLAMTTALNSNLAADQVLFGRMFASRHELDVDAAAQVAHMIGTGPAEMGTDFFTAVDDLSIKESAGSGHMGVKRFSAGTAYGYTTVDLDRVLGHCGQDAAKALIETYARTVATTLPSGSQSGYAAQVFADTVLMTVSRAPLSLDPAFADGVVLPGDAARALLDYASRVEGMYGADALGGVRALSTVHAVDGVAPAMPLAEAISIVADPQNW